MLDSIKNIVANHDVFGAGNVYPVIVGLIIQTVDAAVLARRVPADVMDEVLLDNNIGAAEEDAVAADTRGCTIAPYVVEIISDVVDILAAAIMGDPVIAEALHREDFYLNLVCGKYPPPDGGESTHVVR